MPTAAKRPCPVPRCPNLMERSGYCDAHGGPAKAYRWDTDRRPEVKRLNGHQNKLRRLALFRRAPLCERCEAEGRVTLATIRDHRIPLAEGGTKDISNESGLCRACHDLKTQQESKRGRGL